jgi:hypothetical protein
MSIYSSVLGGVVSALAAEAIDNTSKQAWQKLYSPHEEEQRDMSSLFRSGAGGAIDRTQADCWLAARLHHGLEQKHMSALVGKYSTHKARKVQAISELRLLVRTPAPTLFVYKAVTAWAIPKLKGIDPFVSKNVTITIPLDTPDWRRDAQIAASIAAGKASNKRAESRSADMIVLPKSFYDMNTWDPDARPESTRREWRRNINAALDTLVNEALCHAGEILDIEGLIISDAA